MILLLLRFWREGLIGILALTIGWQQLRYSGLEATIAKERLAAERAAAEFAAKSAAADAANAELARNIEADHATHRAELDSTRADFERRIDERVRNATRAARDRCMSEAAARPGVPAPAATGSGDGSGGDDHRRDRAVKLRDAVTALQVYARDCSKWANEVGR